MDGSAPTSLRSPCGHWTKCVRTPFQERDPRWGEKLLGVESRVSKTEQDGDTREEGKSDIKVGEGNTARKVQKAAAEFLNATKNDRRGSSVKLGKRS